MSNEKYRTLVSLLVRRTKDGQAAWEPTAREGVFALSLPEYSVSIWKFQGEDGSTDVWFEIVNSNGTVIDTFNDVAVAEGTPDKRQAYEAMLDLFETARRQALGVEQALDKLIEELRKD